MTTPTPTPLAAERARLREAGYTDDEISKFFVERLRGASQQPPAAGGAPVQSPMTGVLGNASAVLSHARGTIPAIQRDLANVANRTASPALRAKSAAALACVAVIVAALGYAIYQEWQIHIVNAPPTSTAQRLKAEAEAAVAAEVAKGEAAKARALSQPVFQAIPDAPKPETSADVGCFDPNAKRIPDEDPVVTYNRIKAQKANPNCPPAPKRQ